MFEKVNPAHPDKIADRIAGAIVDYAYSREENPRIAVEVLIGHRDCFIIAETSVSIPDIIVSGIVDRIAGRMNVIYREHPQDEELARNQKKKIKCGDNGIFCGMPITDEQRILSFIAHDLYKRYEADGKYILDEESAKIIACQSNADYDEVFNRLHEAYMPYPERIIVNPLGYWTGGTDVDTGATNRKLGSDMGDAVTGGGLHGKDLSKADVSVNIYAHLKAQENEKPVELYCAIGDEYIDGKPYGEIVEIARKFIKEKGGFEKFAEWGLI